ncbi:MAG: bifunctional 4-hydroxy-2-oxoglutarate aldolase/2-dehydro-3-deoxy-phosphogluconate aldolase [Planctomycetota bacterium]
MSDRLRIPLVEEHGLIAIIRLDDLANCVELSRTLLDAGVFVQEITLTCPGALDTIRLLRDEIAEFSSGQATLGVGSVRTVSDVDAACKAGAEFLVSPCCNPAVIHASLDLETPIVAGGYTPTELASASDHGAAYEKVFPARGLTPSYFKDVLAPLPDLKLIPTGGINCDNMDDYFSVGVTAVGVGGNLVSSELVRRGDWSAVREIANRYASTAAECVRKRNAAK